MECSHISKVLEWGFDENHNFKATLWGCVLCDITGPNHFMNDDIESIDHTGCDDDCFGCKVKTLEMNTGDASRDIPDKKWKAELSAYKDARAQGIQPAGTTRAHVEQAYTASEALGKAYDADSMPKAKDINKNTVEVMKEIGQI